MVTADLLLTGDNKIPIREIARRTGINTVTLRAWERRYGLLQPRRSPTGHRFYSPADVARVQEIQMWLARGLAISKVGAFLKNNELTMTTPIESVWDELRQQIRSTLIGFGRRKLEHHLEEILSLYPGELVGDALMVPLLAELTSNKFGQPARLEFFTNVVVDHLCRIQYVQRQTAQGSRLLAISCSAKENLIVPLIFNSALLVNNFQVEFLNYLPPYEALVALEALNAEALIIHGQTVLGVPELKSQVKHWCQAAKPVILVGAIATVYVAICEEPIPAVYPCETLQSALDTIKRVVNAPNPSHHLETIYG